MDRKPKKTVSDALRDRLGKASLELECRMMESVSLLFGGNSTLDLVSEDPVSDDGEAWTEMGVRHSVIRRGMHPQSEVELERARAMSRGLVQENGFAIGAIDARISYIVGTGLDWRANPKKEGVPEEQTEAINRAIRDFADKNSFCLFEQEAVKRADRDGEAIVRTFRRSKEPLIVRFVEPEDVMQPEDSKDFFGIRVKSGDVLQFKGMHILDPDAEKLRFVPSMHNDRVPQLLHLKANVDLNSRRGWPTLWAARRNFARAEKLLRNMSYVAALQAGIAMIRKHENSTRAQIQSFLDNNSDLLVTDNTTGREMRHTRILPGTIFDTGPGVSYEAPVSSVSPEKNIEILQADLREIAAMLQMPEFMLTANAANANLASTLVSEGPANKGFQRLQKSRGNFLKEIISAAILHAEESGQVPKGSFDNHELVATFPVVVSRNLLMEAQRMEIEHRNKIVSKQTWRGSAGYDSETEKKNLEEEKEENPPPPQLDPNADPTEDPSENDSPPPNAGPDHRDDDEEVGVPKT